MRQDTVNWLLETDSPCVRLRTLRQCGLATDGDANACNAALDALGVGTTVADTSILTGLHAIYRLLAYAETGFSREELVLNDAVDRLLQQPFDAGCGDFMLLRALVMLGFGEDVRVRNNIARMNETQLPDGGWLCLHRLKKAGNIPKSCMKASMHALLLMAEMKLKKLELDEACLGNLINYFTKRRLFYRTDDPARLVLECAPGKRMTDIFFPPEPMRVGLPMLLYALAVLVAGKTPEFQEAWKLLDDKTDTKGRIVLEGTLANSYLPRENVGKPSKWATLYADLAREYCRGGSIRVFSL